LHRAQVGEVRVVDEVARRSDRREDDRGAGHPGDRIRKDLPMATFLLLRRARAFALPAAALLAIGLHAAPAAAEGASSPAKAAPANAAPAEAAPAEAEPAEEEPRAPDADEPAWQREPAVRRSGFTAGLAGGLALGSAAGFPNDVKKLGYARYYTETGVGAGTGGMIWIGAALTDWLTFGLAVGGGTLSAGDTAISTAGFLFHVEAFPLFSLGGLWREVGVIADTGLGGSVTTPSGSDEKLIDGGAVSRVGGGVFYEGFRLWKISTGPFLYGDYTWSATVRQPGALLGWRTVIYVGPPKKKR
jgi:hypothetical protein